MDDVSKLASFAVMSDAEPLPPSFFTAFPEQAKTLTLLYEMSRELTSILNREELLQHVAERLKRLVDYDVFSVMLWNDQAEVLETIFAMRCEEAIPARLRLALHQGLSGSAAGQRRTLRVNDVRDDPRYVVANSGVEVRSELVVPLLLRERLIGVLDLESAAPKAFTAEHERMLNALGPFIAIALENARLYQEARENERRLQSDLDTAREIQLQLLPRGAREIPGLDIAAAYIPARELGGDFYDFLPYGEGHLGLALGDVSGKGTAAALYGSLAIGTLRELVVEHAGNPAEMLALLNRRMFSARLDARFIAMLFATYEAPSRRLIISNAGVPYPLLVRNGNVEEIRIEGVPLGLLSDSVYDEYTLELLPGDIVLFASDGILESDNVFQEEFGPQRLSKLLSAFSLDVSASAIAEKILNATDLHSGPGHAPHDDRTLLVLRVTDEPISGLSKMPIIY
jgi:sigma-B regulation protein RsbU (phosphoserine phosphatase)